MKKILAVAILLIFGGLKLSYGVVYLTDDQAADVIVAQGLNHEGKFKEAVETAPLSYQKAWYCLNELRDAMGATRSDVGYWDKFNFDLKTGKFLGDKIACLKLVTEVKVYVKQATDEGYGGKLAGKDGTTVEDYVEKYESNIKNGLPKEKPKGE